MEAVQMQAAPLQGERMWAAGVHAGALLLAFSTSWSAGIAGMLVGLGVYLLNPGASRFVAEHAREAFNFNLTMFLMVCALVLLAVLLAGATLLTLGLGAIFTLPAGLLLAVLAAAIAVIWLVCGIVATFKGLNGESYRYPLTLRLLK